jgi:hypothetical protein
MSTLQERIKEYLGGKDSTKAVHHSHKTNSEYARERLEIDLQTTQKSLDKLKREFADKSS